MQKIEDSEERAKIIEQGFEYLRQCRDNLAENDPALPFYNIIFKAIDEFKNLANQSLMTGTMPLIEEENDRIIDRNYDIIQKEEI